ncbi:MAG: hypothetical protein Roseis2KO_42790 [Roseivirga sp.]
MKTIKNYLYLLLAGAVVSFSACEGLEEPDDQEPFDPLTLADFYVVNTYHPTVEGGQVTFNGSLKNADATIAYGFMWYVKPGGTTEPEVHRVDVGNGDINGPFTKLMADLPKGVELVVCAFVDYKAPSQQVVNTIGEEIDFTYD